MQDVPVSFRVQVFHAFDDTDLFCAEFWSRRWWALGLKLQVLGFGLKVKSLGLIIMG